MKLFSIASAVLLGSLVTAASIELTPDNIKEEIKSGTWLIEHFSPYCPHCQNFAPEWKKLSDDLNYLAQDADFHFGTIDCSTQGDLCDGHDIVRYPTLQLWKDGEKVDTYLGLNKYDPLTEYILNEANPLKTQEAADDETEAEEEQEEEEEEEEGDETEAEAEAEEEQGEEVELEEAEQPAEEEEEDEQQTEDEEQAEEEEEDEEQDEEEDEEQAEEEDEEQAEEKEEQQAEEEEEEEQQAEEEDEENMGPEIFEDIVEEDEQAVDDVVVEGGRPITPNPTGVSLNLEGKQMREIASGRIPWFIKFYAPWCPHCQRLAPTWVDMAAELRDQVNVGEVNCEALPSVCQEYDIRGFPTLQIYGHGSPIQYAGDRTLHSLLKFAHAHAGATTRDIQLDELNQQASDKDTVLLYLHDEQQSEIPELLTTFADASSIAFYTSQDPQVLNKYDLSVSDLPAVIILKDNTYRIHRYDFSNSEELADWIEKKQAPIDTNKKHEPTLQIQSTQVSVGGWAYSHWFICLVGVGAVGSVVYKYAYAPKANANVLPAYRNDYSHKD